MALYLARCEPSARASVPVRLARLHPEQEGQVYVALDDGTLQHVLLGPSGEEAVVLAQFMLLLQPEDGAMHAVHRTWSDFQLHEGGVVFTQQGSSKLLFAQLPLPTDEPSAIFLFGSHAGEVLALAKLGSLLVSGCAAGVVKMWDVDDGQLIDTKVEPGGPRITALQGVGPFMVAVGSHDGTITILDITTQRLKAVHRFHAGPGPVTALAACLPPHLSATVAVAEGPRSYDGGGVVEPPMGLPWRLTPAVLEAGAEAWRTGALLAVASTAGWLNLYSPVAPGAAEPCWAQQHSGTHHGYPRLAFTSHGSFLALASGIDSSSILLLDTASWAVAKQWALPCRTSALLLDPRSSEERVLGGGLPAMPDLSTVPPSAGLQVVPMVRVTLCAAPEHGMPLLLEARVPPPTPQRQGEGTSTSSQTSGVLPKPQSASSSLPAPFSPDRVPRGPAMELPTAPPYRLSSATLGLMGQLSSYGQMGQSAGSGQAAQPPSDGQTGLPSSAGQWGQSAAPGAASSAAPKAGYAPASNSGSASAGGAIGWQTAPREHVAAPAAGSRVVGSTGEWQSGLTHVPQADIHLSSEQADRIVAAWASGGGAAVNSAGGAAAAAGVQLVHGASPYSPAALPMQGLSAVAAAMSWQRGNVSGAGAADSTDGADGTYQATRSHGASELTISGYSVASGQLPGWTAASPVRQQLPDVISGLRPLSTGAVGAAAAVSSTAAGVRMGMRPGTLPGARSWLTGAPPPSLEGLLAQASSNTEQPRVPPPSSTSTQTWSAPEDALAAAPSPASEATEQPEVVRVQPAHAMGQRHARPEPSSATRYFRISDDDFDDSGAMRAVQGSEQGLGQRHGLSRVREDEEEQEGKEQRREMHTGASVDAAHRASGEALWVAERAHKVEGESSGRQQGEEEAEEEGEEEPLPRHQLSVAATTGNMPLTAGEVGQVEGLDRQGGAAEEDEEPAPRPVPGYLHGWGQGGAAATATTPASRLPAQQHCGDSDEWPSSRQEQRDAADPSWLQHPLQQSQSSDHHSDDHPSPSPADRTSDVHPSHSANLRVLQPGQHQGGGSLSTETGSDVTVNLGQDPGVAGEGNWGQQYQEMQDEAAEHGPQHHQQQQEEALEEAPALGGELLRGRGEGDYSAVDFVSQVPASPGAGAQSRGTSTISYEGQAGNRDALQAPWAAQESGHGDRPGASRPQHREQPFAGRLEMGEAPSVQQQQQQGEAGGQSLAEGLSQPQARMQADSARAQGQRGRTRFLGYKPNTAQLLRQLRAQAKEAAAQPSSSSGPGQGTALAAQAKGGVSRPPAGGVRATVAGPRSRAAAAGGQADGGGAAGAWSLRGRGNPGALAGAPAAAGADAGGTPEPDVGLSPDQGAGSKRVGGFNAWERRGTPSKAGRGAGGGVGGGLGQARGYGRARGAQPQRAADGSIVSFPGGGSVYIPSGASSPATLPSLASPMLMGSPSDALFSRPAGAHGYQQQSLLSASGFSWQPTPAAASTGAGAGGHAGPAGSAVTGQWYRLHGGGGAANSAVADGGSGAIRAAGLGMEKAAGGMNDAIRAGGDAAADWDGMRTPSGQLVPFGDAGAADGGIDHAIAMAMLAGAGEGELARPALCGTGLLLDRLQQLKLGQAPLPPSSPEARQAQHQEALRAAARAVTNLSPDVALYPGLPGLDPEPYPQRLPKQLHPAWLASKQRRPDMGALWSAAEQQQGVCGTRPMAMYERPQASSVAAVVLL